MNKKEKGTQLEIYVAARLAKVLNDPTIRPTKASSGGGHNTELEDILSKDYLIECKNGAKNFSKSVWKKLLNLVPWSSFKIPLHIIKNEDGIFVKLNFEDFLTILGGKK